MDLLHDTVERYKNQFGTDPEVITTAPGRVNLIGEHTDYNDGFVLPIAIDRNIIVAAGRRTDNQISCHSVDLQSTYTLPLSGIEFNPGVLWANYPFGVASVIRRRHDHLGGMNFCIRGTIPIGAGLSSSAALEVSCGAAICILNNLQISTRDLIAIARTAETEFVGVQCGIMDQFVSMMGKKGHALFLDCRSLEFQYVPFPAGIRLLVGDTGIRRELAHSAYNQREAECDEAVRLLCRYFPGIESLRDVSPEQFRAIEGQLSTVTRKRAGHVISENRRVLQSVEAMKKSDLSRLGALMTESHRSLRDDFEVSCIALDAFVDVAVGSPGVYGARMTGAGFGGSGICIVAESMVDELVDRLRSEYPRIAGRSLSVYLASPDDGAAVYHRSEGYLRRNLADGS